MRSGIREWLEIATYLVAVLAAAGSWWQYRRNSQRERARWLFELYQRFYEQKGLKAMRVRLDCGDTGFISKGEDNNLLGDLDDFLNFFEFIAHLWKRKELKLDEVQAMFDYPLHTVAGDQTVLDYVSKYGYDELERLLRKLRHVGPA